MLHEATSRRKSLGSWRMARTSGHLVIEGARDQGHRGLGRPIGLDERELKWMNRAKLAIVALCLACGVVSLGACTMGTVRSPIYGSGWMSDYGQTRPTTVSLTNIEILMVIRVRTVRRGWGSAHTGMRHSRGSSPRSWRVVHRRKAVCYKWHKDSGEWRPDRSDTKDNFGKRAARRLNQ